MCAEFRQQHTLIDATENKSINYSYIRVLCSVQVFNPNYTDKIGVKHSNYIHIYIFQMKITIQLTRYTIITHVHLIPNL